MVDLLRMSTHPSIHMSIHMTFHMPVHLSIRTRIDMSVHRLELLRMLYIVMAYYSYDLS